jgi:hypothetical protein
MTGDPFAKLSLTVDRFACNGDIGKNVTCYDLQELAANNGGVITTKLLKDNSPYGEGGTPYLVEGNKEAWLLDGLYYGGDYPFNFGTTGMKGTITLVTRSYIKMTGENLQLTGYMPANSAIPNLLMYSTLGYPEGKYCANHEELSSFNGEPIDTTGSSGSANSGPLVYHNKKDCVNIDEPSGCYQLGLLHYIGIMYAPNGRVATSGERASYHGAIVAHSIRINGSGNRGGDKVGALFVYDQFSFPPEDQRIHLER